MELEQEKARAPRGPSTPQPLEVAQNPAALLKIDIVRQLTGLGVTSIYAKMAKGEFPEAVRLGARCTRWRASSVMAWLESPR